MPTPPALSADQRKAAFDRSLEVRRERANFKWLLGRTEGGSGKLLMRQILTFPEAEDGAGFLGNYAVVASTKVYDLLTALPGVGKAKALILLAQAGIPAKNTVRACGPKQRERLFTLL